MRIGIIGVGNMGSRMAKNFLKAGVDVGLYDINEKALQELVHLGANAIETPAELARTYPYIITILPNSNIVKATIFGENGLIEGLHRGSMIIEMTTAIPTITKEIASNLEERGLRMIDAPVSGGVVKAEDGTLTIMVGGKEQDFEEVQSYLKIIGENIVHVGSIGAGHTIKALNNMVSATTLAVTGEALALGVKLGLNPEKMLDVINSSTGRSFSSEFKFPAQVLTRNFGGNFSIDLMVKDITIALGMADEQRTPMVVSSATYQLWKQALAQSDPNVDHTEVIKHIEKMTHAEIQGSKLEIVD
ncbi:NAD(P)-dependent oxidoreductase [Robertmurraya kyonggiensis]|uniref:NAD(P)-dependent oxidoreductase n=1 Tax=Robertmurraya kyonggiensis TaxID=1037680 RepID=A0A4U1DDF8_9BACI|nr:NAD(P)-dependent oxidoreductase [Robertmurraya kyonggiensis]TKC19466.1 NAD(P)-dependent oxidoreductase [Robertmurraya kyonggiensis]